MLGESAGAGEAPDDDDRGEALDRGVKAEAEQRDGAGEDRRGDRDCALGGHVGEAEPGQRLRAADQAVALGQLEPALLPRGVRRLGDGRQLKRRGAHERHLGEFEVRVEQPAAGVGQRVEDDLVLAPRAREAGAAQRAQVVADEVLRSRGDPGEVADAQLLAVAQGERDQKPRRVGERLRTSRRPCREIEIQALADRLGARQVQTQQIAAILGHELRLTHVALRVGPRPINERSSMAP